jgi:hypothetical protein
MAAIRAAQGRPAGGPDEVARLADLYCGWMALLSWSVRPPGEPDDAKRTRLTECVMAAATLDR